MRGGFRGGDDGGRLKKLILAVADWIDGNVDEPPPELQLYLQIRDWGDPWGGGWMRWPARLFVRLRLVRNVYNAWQGYAKAENRVEWLKKHESGAGIVGMVKELRFEEEEEKGRVETWEAWGGRGDE